MVVEVVEMMRLLGVKVVTKKDCYAENGKKKVELAERMANVGWKSWV